jgi:serine/threonine-protein kinase
VTEPEFINLAIQKKAATFEQIQECLKEQAGRPGTPIWDILVDMGFAGREQVDAVLQGKEPPKTYAFGPYVILGRIGEGGMGTVYRATRRGDSKVVALKLLPERFSKSENVKRFEREAQIAISLSHPNLVKGYERGQVGGRWYYSMEYVQGQTVSDLVGRRGPLDPKAALQIAAQIADALVSIHRAGLVHRDVKPDNIVVGEDGVAKLMDLGLVKSTVTEQTVLTQSGHTVGTLHYMSPEQTQGKDVDIRSDIYSLGATLYHMVSGRKPFEEAKTPLDVIRAQLRGRLPRASADHPALNRLIEAMTSRDPAARYADPVELGADLRRVIEGGQPERAAPPTMRKRPAPRSRTGALIGAAVAAIAAIGVVTLLAWPKPKPQARVEPPRTDPGPAIEREIEQGRLAEASLQLEREATHLSGARALELRKRLEAEAGRLWAEAEARIGSKEAARDFQGARREIEELRPVIAAIAGMSGKLDERAKRIDELERADPQREAETRFRALEESIRPLVANREYERAIGVLEGSRSVAQESPALAAMIEARIRSLRELARPAPEPDVVGPLWKKATEEAEAGRNDAAILTLGQLLRESPEEARAYGLRALCFHRMKMRENAIEDARRAVKLDPNDARAARVLGEAALAESQFSEAVTHLTRSISGDPTQVELYLMRAKAWIELIAWTEGLRDLDEAERRRPGLADSIETIALRIRALEGAGRTADAAAECGRWIKVEPLAGLLRRAALRMKLKEFKEARTDYLEALKLDPKNEAALKGRDQADLALKPPPEPPPPPPEPKEPTAAQIKKRLAERLNASTERLTPQKDGTWKAVLIYDFSKPDELKDFAGEGFKPERRGVELEAGSGKTSLLVHQAKFTGDFQLRVDLILASDEAADWGLRTSTSADPKANEAPGVGVGLKSGPQGQILLGTAGQGGGLISPARPIATKSGVPAHLLFKRDGDKYSALYAGMVSCEGEKPGLDPAFMRFYSRVALRLIRLEIQGTLHPDWVHEGGVRLTEEEKKVLCGTYEIIVDGKKVAATVSLADGVLKLTGGDGIPHPLAPTSRTRFKLTESEDFAVEFLLEKGRPQSMAIEQFSKGTRTVLQFAR